jgi:hypothetical protein
MKTERVSFGSLLQTAMTLALASFLSGVSLKVVRFQSTSRKVKTTKKMTRMKMRMKVLKNIYKNLTSLIF